MASTVWRAGVSDQAAGGPSRGPWMASVLEELSKDRTAVRSFAGDWSGPELLRRAAGAAEVLRSVSNAGVAVPALLSSSPTSIALTLGAAFSGRPLAPLGTRLTPSELVPLVRGLGTAVLVADEANERVATDVAAAAGARLVVVDRVAAREPDFVATTPDSVVMVLHTSGTTGQPKPVFVRDAAVFHRSRAYQTGMGLAPGDLYCSTGGFHHTGGIGMLFVAVACGAGVVPFPRFSVERWREVRELEPSAALLVPTMIDALLEAGALGAVDLRALHYGTAPVHPDTLRAALDALGATEFCQAYGMTEGGPISILDHADHVRALAGEPGILRSVGRPLANLDWRLDAVSDDGVGELAVSGPQIFQPGPDGWLRTGDLARVVDGYLFLQGRRGDTIIRGGENIYPLEVERVLELHPGVREAAVVGVADRRWGQVVRAVVVVRDGAEAPAAADLAEHCRTQLAGFKVPVEWVFTSTLPRNAAGKLLRRDLGGLGG